MDIQAAAVFAGDEPARRLAGEMFDRVRQRVGSAVGEGAMAVQFVEEYLKEI
jgi:hypothetical protein